MHRAPPRALALLLLAFASVIAMPAPASERLIVKLRNDGAKAQPTAQARAEKLSRIGGAPLRHLREMSRGADVVIADTANAADTDRVLAALANDADVEFAQRDRRRHALQATVPVNDLFAPQQRYLANTATAISAFAAWDVTHGSPSTVVAVVDTGYLPHPGLAGRILPGYDMITIPAIANDGDGRDADAQDPGDGVAPADLADLPPDCDVRNSTWHGTGVAGIIAANTNDGAWTAGIDWAAKILPVRVLGRCGGFDSDIADAIAWAAGLPVPGVPVNPTPAQVINLSLGGEGACEPVYQGLAAAVYARGVTKAIVAAAGNDGGDVANDSPANCPGFLAIASTTGVSGSLASFSNSGAGITLSAPGGAANFRTPADSVIVLSNSGTSAPTTYSVVNEGGTSVSAPMVSGTIALMLAVAPSLTPDQVVSILQATAKPFPGASSCTTATCGAGIVDAGAAVRAASLAPAPAANYQGLWWAAPAGSESGWGINFAHQGDIIFATWFTYDVDGNAWWLSMIASKTAPNVFAGELLQTRGPAFSAVPFDPAAVTRTSVGHATLTFTDANTAQFAYTVNGVSQTKTIIRERFAAAAPTCTFGAPPNVSSASNYQDLWWAAPAGSESGWGINLTEQADMIFGTWFTYDAAGAPLWLSVLATQRTTGVFSGPLMRTHGPPFSATPFDPASVSATAVGTATFTFSDPNTATFAYTVGNVAQSKTITREVFVSPGTYCH